MQLSSQAVPGYIINSVELLAITPLPDLFNCPLELYPRHGQQAAVECSDLRNKTFNFFHSPKYTHTTIPFLSRH